VAHFAQLDADNKVVNVIVLSDDDCGGGVFPDSEPIGQAFLASLNLDGVFKQTSFNTYRNYAYTYDEENPPNIVGAQYLGSAHRTGGTPFRGQYAGIGDFYDADLDEFVTPESETQDETE